MKKYLLTIALVLGLVTSCQNEESALEQSHLTSNLKVTASLDDTPNSRTAMQANGANSYKVVWSENDTISIFTSNTAQSKWGLTTGAGQTDADFEFKEGSFSFGTENSTNKFGCVGVYPYSKNTTVSKSDTGYFIQTEIPTNQTYSQNTFGQNVAPMVAVSSGLNLAFKNAYSVMGIPLKGESTITKATLISSESNIAGAINVTYGNEISVVADNTKGSSAIILSCEEGIQLKENEATLFYIVLSPGTYQAKTLAIKFYDSTGKYYQYTFQNEQTFDRGEVITFKDKTFGTKGEGHENGTAGIEEANNALANGNEDVTVTIAESDNTPTLELPETDSENPTNLTFDNTIPGDKTITIKASTESDNKEAKEVNLTVPQGTNGNFDIQLPNSTVSLNATNGTATYNNVIAETAENTLIVGQDVTINKLTVKKGNVRVHGTVNSIERHSANSGSVTIIVEEGASIPENLDTQVFNIITSKKVTTAKELNEAIAANSNIIVLGADITSSEIITINKSITLDGNGYTLTSTATRAINVSGANGITIKNLTINASGERAINIIQNATNVTIDHVTATAANYTVNVASSASEAVVNITNSDLTGLNVINIGASGAQIAVNQTKITCNDQTDVENYGAITLNSDATKANVVATNVTFDIKGDSKQVNNGATGATVSINGANVPQNAVAKIEYGAYYYSFETIEGAISKAKPGETVKLIANVTASSIIVVDKAITLDGNGKTLTSTAERAINVSGADGVTIKNLTINASGERAINIIQNATNVTIDNVTATAANYTVNVARSAPSAKVEIKNSTLTGLCTVNVSAAGAVVTVDGCTINCNDNNTTEGEAYSALSLNKDAVNGQIIATGCTINVVEGSDSSKGRNGATGGKVTIDGETDEVKVMVAAITYPNSSYYHAFATLAEAVEFAKEGNVISLLRDIELSESITIPAGKNIVLDLNGKTISQEFAQTTAYAMITNKGTLTVMDSSSEKTGKISYADVTEYSKDNNYASNTIKNEGVLNLKSGTIENVSNDNVMNFGYPHAIDAYQGSITNIEGGTVKSANYDCIRMFCNSTTLATTVNISGGKIINRVSFQNPSSNAAGYGVLNISGGEFTTTDNVNANVRLLNFSTDITKMSAKISGGTFDKGVKTQNYSSTSIALTDWLTIENVNITEIK